MTALLRVYVDRPFATVAVLLAVEFLAAALAFGTGVEGLKAAARYSGRTGLFLFAVVFAIAPLQRLAPGPALRHALSRRRSLGLAFGVHHMVHLLPLLAYLQAAGKELDPGRTAGGVAGYALLAAMMATSSDAAVRAMGPARWRLLHRIGAWYLWVGFALTYVPRLQGKVLDAGGSPPIFVACMALVVGLGLLRIVAFARRRAWPSPIRG